MIDQYKGSCLCQDIEFCIEGSFDNFFLCHCRHCQKDTGSAHSANLFSSSATLQWICGEEKITNYQLPNTRHQKSFCARCGSSLPSIQMNGKIIVIPAGSLDSDILTQPTAHLFTSSKASWDDQLELVKKFKKYPHEK
jgi:hypothetical protein